jgi:hypothetical protein
VNHYKTQPPWEFLLSASRNSLQSYELSRLSHAANLRKEIGALLDLWMEENSAAMLARWLMEQRERPRSPTLSRPSVSVERLAQPCFPSSFCKHRSHFVPALQLRLTSWLLYIY